MLQKPKGTYDLYGEMSEKYDYLKRIFSDLANEYNLKYISTPIFESSSLFHRGVGETTDIVTKETYDFKDRGDRDITLRPEGTAGIVRSVIENKLYVNLPLKLWYIGPMFRYERPQAGRYRQFTQAGVEIFGDETPLMDANVISIMVKFYQRIGLKGIKVRINSIGNKESRENYRDALLKHFKPYLDDLCDDCKSRYEKNPLRILDCKVDGDKECMKNVPKILDYLDEKSKKHFDDVLKYLDVMNIEYVIDDKLVRGLDYYTDTVFEVEADIEGFGSQNVIGAGGRYNNLVENMEGPSVPAVGFAFGIERIINALDAEDIKIINDNSLDVYILPISDNEMPYAVELSSFLRDNAFSVDIDYTGKKMNNKFKEADRYNSKFIIILGENEVKDEILTIKDNVTKEEVKVERANLLDYLDVNI
ncbi:MAG: histidine--tRNA ligase [Bacilli bacterium]|nr:histidine--tRNA ligase [Bacilli bacterium]